MKKEILTFLATTSLVLGASLISQSPAVAESACVPGSRVDVQGCDFTERDFFNAGFDYANFSNTNLTLMRARYSYWSSVNLSGANLTSANLYQSWMAGANFTNANLTFANLTNTNLDNADFTGANLSGVSSGGIQGTPINLPEGWKLLGGYLIGPGANLDNANLQGLNLDGVSLVGASLNNLKSARITGSPLLPEKWQLNGGYLFGPGANLENANLDNIDIWFQDFSNVNLRGASVNGASFIYSKSFAGLKSGGLTGKMEQLIGASIVNGYLISSGVDLQGANLQRSDLSYLNMTGANLTGADFTESQMRFTDLRQAIITNTDFTASNLLGANLSGSNIFFSSFDGANLNAAKIEESIIRSSEFHNTSIDGTSFNFTTILDVQSSSVTGVPLMTSGFGVQNGEMVRYFTEIFAPTITGEAKTNGTLGIDLLQDLPEYSSASYQWLRDGVAISGATDSIYQVTPADANKLITVRLTATKSGFLSRNETSFGVTPGNASMTLIKPRLSGVVKIGKKLTAVVSAWAPSAKITYQWLRNGKPIKGATKNVYTLVSADKKKKISVKVTQTALGYTRTLSTSLSKTVKK